ncbi:MAG: hypothetical protein IJY27_06780 [Clostridia bacterium]|nr:hypothetical protein [Clostridia bacterium]
MKKGYLVFGLAVVMAVIMIIGMALTTGAADGGACTTEGCTGTYTNGFCSADSTHYEVAQQVSETHHPELNSTHNGYYAIENAGQLYWFAAQVDSRAIGNVETISMTSNFSKATYYTVTVNAVLTDNITVNQNVLNASGNLNSGTFREWTPIGYRNYDTYYIAFSGIFDGNGKSISGLVYNHYGTDIRVDSSVGLFSYIHGAATIKNTTIADSYFAGSDRVGAFAGFAGEQQDQKVDLIENCVNKATVKGYQNCGGIVGKGYLTINNCRNEGKVLAFHQGGGIAGFTEYDTVITNTVNTGDVVWVTEKLSKIVLGGFVGYVGGRSAYNALQTFKNCYNTGNVIISSNLSNKYSNEVGGFFGYCGNAKTVENCYNYGTLQITGTYTSSQIGSFAGSIYNSTVTNCYYNTTDATYGAVNNADSDGITGKEASAFASGEVCYLLNGSTSEGDLVWYQTIGTHTTPQFSGKTVYYDESATPQYYNETSATSVKFVGASITVGQDLTMNYYVEIYDSELIANIASIAMRFTRNGKTELVYAGEPNTDGQYVFAYEHIAPQCMGDLIDAELVVVDGENATVIASKMDYSVKENAAQLLQMYPDNAELVQLVTDMLYYGAASQTYRNYNADALVTANVTGLGSSSADTAVPTATDMELSTSTGTAKFTAAGVRFSNVNKLYVKLNTIENVTLKVNGKDVTLTDTTFYTDAIYATGFDTVYTFELYENGTLVQTLKYSVKSYVYVMKDSSNTAMAALAKALYAYGKSAIAYYSN